MQSDCGRRNSPAKRFTFPSAARSAAAAAAATAASPVHAPNQPECSRCFILASGGGRCFLLKETPSPRTAQNPCYHLLTCRVRRSHRLKRVRGGSRRHRLRHGDRVSRRARVRNGARAPGARRCSGAASCRRQARGDGQACRFWCGFRGPAHRHCAVTALGRIWVSGKAYIAAM